MRAGARAGQAIRDAVGSREEMRRVVEEVLNLRSRYAMAGAVVVVLTLGGVVYVYRRRAREVVIDELSDVASRSLGDEKMQAQAQQTSIQTLQALLEHPATVQRSVDFVSAVCEKEQTRQVLISLLVDALKSRAVIEQALGLVLWVLDNEKAREHLVSALIAALRNERFREAASEFAVVWLQRERVRSAVADVFKEASIRVLENSNVRSDAEQFVKVVLQQPDLQAKTSEHLWAAVKGLVVAPKVKKTDSYAARNGNGGAPTPTPDGSGNGAAMSSGEGGEGAAALDGSTGSNGAGGARFSSSPPPPPSAPPTAPPSAPPSARWSRRAGEPVHPGGSQS